MSDSEPTPLPVSQQRMSDAGRAALSQAASSIGHAVEVLDAANIAGNIRDDAALLMERIAVATTGKESR